MIPQDHALTRFLRSFSRVINLLLIKLARDRIAWRISVPCHFCLVLAALGPYRQDLAGPMFSQYGPRAWLIRYKYLQHKALIRPPTYFSLAVYLALGSLLFVFLQNHDEASIQLKKLKKKSLIFGTTLIEYN